MSKVPTLPCYITNLANGMVGVSPITNLPIPPPDPEVVKFTSNKPNDPSNLWQFHPAPKGDNMYHIVKLSDPSSQPAYAKATAATTATGANQKHHHVIVIPDQAQADIWRVFPVKGLNNVFVIFYGEGPDPRDGLWQLTDGKGLTRVEIFEHEPHRLLSGPCVDPAYYKLSDFWVLTESKNY